MRLYIDALNSAGTDELRDICFHLGLQFGIDEPHGSLAERINTYVTHNARELKGRLPGEEQMTLGLLTFDGEYFAADSHFVTILERLKIIERRTLAGEETETAEVMFMPDDLKKIFRSIRSYHPDSYGRRMLRKTAEGFLTAEGVAPLDSLKQALEHLRSILKENGRVIPVKKFMEESLLISYCSFEHDGTMYLKHPMIKNPYRILEFKKTISPHYRKGISPISWYLSAGTYYPSAPMDAETAPVAGFTSLMDRLGYNRMQARSIYTDIFIAMNEGDMPTVKNISAYIVGQCPEHEKQQAYETVAKAYENMPLWIANGASMQDLFCSSNPDNMKMDLETSIIVKDRTKQFWKFRSNEPVC